MKICKYLFCSMLVQQKNKIFLYRLLKYFPVQYLRPLVDGWQLEHETIQPKQPITNALVSPLITSNPANIAMTLDSTSSSKGPPSNLRSTQVTLLKDDNNSTGKSIDDLKSRKDSEYNALELCDIAEKRQGSTQLIQLINSPPKSTMLAKQTVQLPHLITYNQSLTKSLAGHNHVHQSHTHEFQTIAGSPYQNRVQKTVKSETNDPNASNKTYINDLAACRPPNLILEVEMNEINENSAEKMKTNIQKVPEKNKKQKINEILQSNKSSSDNKLQNGPSNRKSTSTDNSNNSLSPSLLNLNQPINERNNIVEGIIKQIDSIKSMELVSPSSTLRDEGIGSSEWIIFLT